MAHVDVPDSAVGQAEERLASLMHQHSAQYPLAGAGIKIKADTDITALGDTLAQAVSTSARQHVSTSARQHVSLALAAGAFDAAGAARLQRPEVGVFRREPPDTDARLSDV